MSGASASPGPSSSTSPATTWKEYKNQDGRKYWYNPVDKKSVWEKPDELRTPRERAILSTRWREYKSGEKTYYANVDSKQTTWDVPKDVKDALAKLDTNGNDEVRTASPSVARAKLAEVERSPTDRQSSARGTASPAPSAPGPAPGPPPVMPPGPSNGNQTPGGSTHPGRPVYSGPPPGFGGPGGPGGPGAPPGPPPSGPAPMRPPPLGPAAQFGQPPASLGPAPVFSSPQEAFKTLLRNKNVTSTSTWEQTMRDIVTDPLYKALRSLAERKAAFTEYQSDLRRHEAEQRAQKREQIKPTVTALFKSAADKGQLKDYSSWRSVMKHLSTEAPLKAAIAEVGEEEVKPFWEDVRKDLRKAKEAQERELRHRNMDLLMSLLRTFEADTTTRWRDAYQTVVESNEWKSDAHLSAMDLSDMVTVFDEYIRSIEREANDRKRSEEKKRSRDERRRRDAFRLLMIQGREEGWIHSKTTWPEVYHSRLKKDERFISMLGQHGSTPLDLFFDALDACDRSIEGRIAAVESLIKMGDAEWDRDRIDPNATWEDFLGKVQAGLAKAQDSQKWQAVAKEDRELRLVWEELVAVATRLLKESRKRHERHIRHLIDDARYGLKKACDDDLIAKALADTPYADISERIEQLGMRDWRRFDEDISDQGELQEVKRVTWEKFCRRQKEKAEERRIQAEEEAAAAAAAAKARRASRERSADGGGSSAGIKRKSEANEYDSRERERARRREDRDSRRRGGSVASAGGGGGGGSGGRSDDHDRDRDREREREGEREREREKDRDRRVASTRGPSRERTATRDSHAPPTSKTSSASRANPPSTSTNGTTGGGGGGNGDDDDDDDDKEEGEV